MPRRAVREPCRVQSHRDAIDRHRRGVVEQGAELEEEPLEPVVGLIGIEVVEAEPLALARGESVCGAGDLHEVAVVALHAVDLRDDQ